MMWWMVAVLVDGSRQPSQVLVSQPHLAPGLADFCKGPGQSVCRAVWAKPSVTAAQLCLWPRAARDSADHV